MSYFCEFCGKEYLQNSNHNKKYCSRKCKEKANAKNRRQKNPDYEQEKYQKRKDFIINNIINPAKINGCEICGNKDIRVLDFHHKDRKEKNFEISRWRAYSQKAIKQEINKCMIVCANCHRILHSEEST